MTFRLDYVRYQVASYEKHPTLEHALQSATAMLDSNTAMPVKISNLDGSLVLEGDALVSYLEGCDDKLELM